MGERTEHPPGTFSWADLSTTDTEGAKAFYTGLFGWDTEDNPIPDGGVYTMLAKGGKAVGGLSATMEGQPAAWNCYVTVESADDGAAAAGEQGGTVIMEPFDVMDVGRMAVIQYPQGAFFMVWEPRASIGAEVVNGPGALSWNELASPDPPESADFYGSLFGWRAEQMESSPMEYLILWNGERTNGGIRELGEPVQVLHELALEVRLEEGDTQIQVVRVPLDLQLQLG